MSIFDLLVSESTAVATWVATFNTFVPLLAYITIGFAVLGIGKIAVDIRTERLSYFSHVFDTIFKGYPAIPYHHMVIGFWAGALTIWILK